jgi:hypothetical protein
MIEQIQARLGLDGTAFKKGLTSAKADWKRFTSDTESSIKSMFGFAAAAAGVKILANEMLALKRRAEDLGVSVEFAQSIERLAIKFGGTSEDAANAMTRLSEAIGQARIEGGAAEKKFSDMGIALEDANGNALGTEAIFKSIADKYRNTEDAAQRSAIAIEFFGKAGRNINNILGEGADGIDAYTRAMERLGLIASSQNVAAVADTAEKMKLSLSGLGATLLGGASRLVGAGSAFFGALAGGQGFMKAVGAGGKVWDGTDASSQARQNASAIASKRKLEDAKKIAEINSDIEKMRAEADDENRLQTLKREVDIAREAAKAEDDKVKKAEKLRELEKAKLALLNEQRKVDQQAAEEHMGRMDKLNDLLAQRRAAQETVADRARFSLDELANANLRGVRDPGTRADIIKAREVRDLQAKAERERLSGAVGSRERALAFLSRADTIRQGITSLKSDERLTSIDRSLVEAKDELQTIRILSQEAGLKVVPRFA